MHYLNCIILFQFLKSSITATIQFILLKVNCLLSNKKSLHHKTTFDKDKKYDSSLNANNDIAFRKNVLF